MKPIPNTKYSKGFRLEAVRLITEQGVSIGEAANRLTTPKSSLENWVRTFKTDKLGKVGTSQRPLTDIEIELTRKKIELVFQRHFSFHRQAVQKTTELVFYNRQRIQQRLGCLSPAAFGFRYDEFNMAA